MCGNNSNTRSVKITAAAQQARENKRQVKYALESLMEPFYHV